MKLLLDIVGDNEVKREALQPYIEVEAEQFEFETERDNQIVQFNITLPVTFEHKAFGFQNGAFRVYLDGDGYHTNGKQWNGWLLANGGSWCFWRKLTTGGRVSCSYYYAVPKAGKHIIRTMFVGGDKKMSGVLRSRRHYQVMSL